MIQELYQKAMKFAREKHSAQTVPGTNANYLLHISNVAMEIFVAYTTNPNFDIDFAIQVTVLHDTLEDTTTDFKDLKTEFGKPIAEAVQALTKDNKLLSKTERMTDCLTRINALQKEVGLVKIADRITNLQSPPKHWSKDKITQYCKEAQQIALTLQNKNEYLHKRLITKIAAYQKANKLLEE
ncbi:HD domain-containing protein [Zunongwangia sp.]|uniref:HD domain-containing protein n=1 Tax=Zunongwangia sp. TaxID=1965325 RepID=UPI003AA986BB